MKYKKIIIIMVLLLVSFFLFAHSESKKNIKRIESYIEEINNNQYKINVINKKEKQNKEDMRGLTIYSKNMGLRLEDISNTYTHTSKQEDKDEILSLLKSKISKDTFQICIDNADLNYLDDDIAHLYDE